MNQPRMSRRSSENGENSPRVPWRRPVWVALALLVMLPLAYYYSYDLFGRSWAEWRDVPGWRGQADLRLHQFWDPVRRWEQDRSRRRTARNFSGRWEGAPEATPVAAAAEENEDPPLVEVHLEPGGEAVVKCTAVPELNISGTWAAPYVGAGSDEVGIGTGTFGGEFLLLWLEDGRLSLRLERFSVLKAPPPPGEPAPVTIGQDKVEPERVRREWKGFRRVAE